MDTTCTCGRTAVHYRRNERRHYCARCFCRLVEKKFRKTVGAYKLIQPGDRIAVALSGGKDSTVTLALMHMLVRKRRNVELFALSIDEGITGYREGSLKKAKELCSLLDVKHIVCSFTSELGASLDTRTEKDYCTFCGVGRRYILNKVARHLRATKLCFGHNVDDEAQSVLMNFLRGDLLRAGRMGVVTNEALKQGCAGFVPRIKPLRFLPEREIALYALLKKLPFSAEECPYIAGMRPEVRTFLNSMEARHPGTKFSLLEAYDRIVPTIRSAVAYKNPLLQCEDCGEPSSRKVCKTCELWGAQGAGVKKSGFRKGCANEAP